MGDDDSRTDTTIYMAVVNDNEQYSIWPADRELPLGWHDTGMHGLKPAVLAWINEAFTNSQPSPPSDGMEGGEGC